MSLKQRIKTPIIDAVIGVGRFRANHGRQQPIDLARISSIMVVQLGGIGDVLLVFPLLRQLKKTFPDKSLSTVTEYGEWLFALAPDLCGGITHRRLDLSQSYLGKLRQIRDVRKTGFDLVISTARGDGVVETSLFAWLAGAKIRIGYRQERSAFAYTHTRDFSYQTPIVEQNLGLLELLHCSSTETGLGIVLSAELESKAKLLLAQRRESGGPVIVFHPFAGNFAEFKSWPLRRYAQLATRLIEEYSANIVVLGSASDRGLWESTGLIEQKQKVTNLCGQVSFSESAALIRHSDLFIGNDSSLMHLAESIGVPAIGIFGSTSPAQILPRGHGTTVVRRDLNCSPCYLHQPRHTHRCRSEKPLECLTGLDVNSIFMAAAERLAALRGGENAHRH